MNAEPVNAGNRAATTGTGLAPADQAGTPTPLVRLSGWVLLVAAAQFAALVATSTRYGYHRDEMYFVLCGAHPAFGYPDQPPLVPLVCWAMNWLAPGSLLVLRLPSALAAAATTVLAAAVARETGGDRRAQVIAAVCTASSGFALAVGHFVTTTTFDLLSTSALGWLLLRTVHRRRPRALLAAGIVTGLGFEAKPQVALVAAVAVAAVLALGPRMALRSPWAVAGTVAAVILAAPYLLWQTRHGWPQLTVASNIAGTAEGGRAGFVPFQLVMVSPVLAPVWIAGLIAPFRRPALRAARFLPVTYGVIAATYLLTNGKAYYLASLYPVLLGLGAQPVSDWLASGRPRLRAWTFGVAVALSIVVSAYIALPLLPAATLQGSAVMAINPDQGETVGWPAFIRAVRQARAAVPAAQRGHTAIYAANYGEAGAVDLLGRGLPRAYSGQNAFSEWGHPPPSATHALVIGFTSPANAAPYFRQCTVLDRVDNGVGLDNDEQGLPIMWCVPAASWAALWPHLTYYA